MKQMLFILTLLFTFPALAELQCLHLHPIMVKIMTNHVNSPKFNSTLEERTINQYIKSLDGAKMYFTKKDIKNVKGKLDSFYTNLRKRDCKFITEVHDLYIKKLKERADFAKKYLKDLKEIDKSAKLVLDPEERDYAENQKDLEAFQKKHIHLQLANILLTEEKFGKAKDLLKRRYVRQVKQTKEESEVDVFSNFLQAFAHTLDPHTSYLSKKMFEDFQINMSLSLEGIGATLSSKDGYTVIEQLVTGGAAQKSGMLQSQDKILAVAQGKKGKYVPIYDMDLSEVVRLIRGKRGTKVRLKVLRKEDGDNQSFELTLVREKINLEDEAAQISYIEKKVGDTKKTIGLLTLPSFYSDNRVNGRSSAKDVKKLLIEANKKGVDALVLDLASNGGGDLDSAVKIAGMFFKTGNVVSHEELKLMDIDPSIYYSGPLVVHINRLSASASEIVSGALKDYKRAVVVGGDHTFGKGSVQQVLRLSPELGSIKFTVGLFYLPGGQSTQHVGVSSDIVFPSPLNTDEIGEKSLDYSLPTDTVKSFISKSAYEANKENAWTPINDKMLKSLEKKSKQRIAEKKEFQEIKKELKKEKDKMISISEILNEKDSEAREKREKLRAMSKEDRKKEYIKSPEIQEAVNIALDLASQINMIVANNRSSSKDSTN